MNERDRLLCNMGGEALDNVLGYETEYRPSMMRKWFKM